ncbi:MAG: ester cyclase [Actinomycetota bacterium]
MRSLSKIEGRVEDNLRMPLLIATLIETFYEELWNRWNDAAVDDTLDAAFDFRGSLGQQTTGRDEWRSYRNTIRAGSADFHNEVVSLVCEGRRAAARLRYSGTHTGPLLDLQATQRRFEYAGAAFFVADGRRLVSAWVLGDLDGLRRQLA